MREIVFMAIALLVIVPMGLLLTIKTALDDAVAKQASIQEPINVSIVIDAPTTSEAISLDVPVNGSLTDKQRFALAVEVGFPDPVTMTAISFAENGSGNPAALSPANSDGSRDLGLWQINSGWWPTFGGQQALTVPLNNAKAAFAIFQRQGLCAWSTYSPCKAHACGPPCYSDFLSRARAAERGN